MDCMTLILDKHLALRPYNTQGREPEECLPYKLEAGSKYEFDKSGRRILPLKRPIPLNLTHGNNRVQIYPPLAAITIIEPTHYISEGTKEVRTRGKYLVEQLFGSDQDIQAILEFFEGIHF